jgi:general secretion pathway protein G
MNEDEMNTIDMKPTTQHFNATKQGGFSLMEIIIVVTIIGLIAAWAATNIFGKQEQTQARIAKAKLVSLSGPLDLYKLDTGRYPNTQEGLRALLTNPGNVSNWNGPYVKNADELKDPWRTDLIYKSPGDANRPYELTSLGADNKEGGEGANRDINSWE